MRIPVRQYLGLLISYLRPQAATACLLALLILAGIGLQLLNPQVLRVFVDSAETGRSDQVLIRAALAFIAIALGQQAVVVATTYLSEMVGWRATNALRADLATHCLKLDMAFHNARTPGELIERIDGDITVLASFFSQLVLRVAGNLLLLVGVLAVLFAEDWRVGAAMTGVALVALTALTRLRRWAGIPWTQARQSSAEQAGFVEERFGGTEDLRASGAVPYVLRQLHAVMRSVYQAYWRARFTSHHSHTAARVLFGLGTVLALGLGAWLYQTGQATIGTVYMLMTYAAVLAAPLQQLIAQAQDLQQADASIGRVSELLHTSPQVTDGPGAKFSSGALSVEFDHASFAYGPERRVLAEVSFQLAPGRVLGLLGRTGSGKTSLTRLLFRLYDVNSGAVRLGGIDVRQATLAQLRSRVGLVTQEVQLFHGTLRDNLTLFHPGISDEQLRQAIQSLGLGDWIRTLPNGLDTTLAAGGGGLSAGEAQLLAFTRVLLKDPGLVILDEASSRLDPATERLIEGAVDRLQVGRTLIIIAHRLSTVMRADEIMILEAGRIVEHGPRAALQADASSRFAQLLRTGLEAALA